MKSGLYDRAGVSATRRDAAWAKRFELPVTKASKVYLSFSVERPSDDSVEYGAMPLGARCPLLAGSPGSTPRMSVSSSKSGRAWGEAGRASSVTAMSRPISDRFARSRAR